MAKKVLTREMLEEFLRRMPRRQPKTWWIRIASPKAYQAFLKATRKLKKVVSK